MTPAELVRSWREGPRGILRFCQDQFHVEPEPFQEKALTLWASPEPADQRIALKACAGPGKSAVLAWAGLWFMACQGAKLPNHPQGAVCSITHDNLRDNLWKEYAKWMGVSPFCSAAFTIDSRRIASRDHPETWFISARSFSKTASEEQQGATLSGLHSKYVFAQVDESGAVPRAILRAGEQALARCEFGKLMQAGNPISLDGMLHEACNRLRAMWKIITVTGDPERADAWVNSPRFKAQHREGAPCACPACWARQQIVAYGRDNPWVQAYILGEFPPASINSLLGIEDVERAIARVVRPEEYSWSQKRLGVDVARFGDDRTVIFPRQGIFAARPQVLRNKRTTEIAAVILEAERVWQLKKGGGQVYTILDDTGGWGHGVYDCLHTAGRGVLPVVYSDKAIDGRFANRRAEMWIKMADAVKAGLRLPDLPELPAELTAVTYTFNAQGKFQLEDKEQVKKRLGRSPDLADALALTYAIPDQPDNLEVGGTGPRKVRRKYADLDDEQELYEQPAQGARLRRRFEDD